MGAFPFLVGGRDRTSRSYVLGHVVPPQATDRFDRVAMTVRCDYLLAMQTGQSGSIEIRVRYAECDPMGVAHHSAYAPWFEMGRTELLRTTGGNYRDLESAGILLAVVKLAIQAGREVRVIVDAKRADDVQTFAIAAAIAKRVEEEMTFPGEIKVTVLREVRAEATAR